MEWAIVVGHRLVNIWKFSPGPRADFAGNLRRFLPKKDKKLITRASQHEAPITTFSPPFPSSNNQTLKTLE